MSKHDELRLEWPARLFDTGDPLTDLFMDVFGITINEDLGLDEIAIITDGRREVFRFVDKAEQAND